jgi:hypothetical protein
MGNNTALASDLLSVELVLDAYLLIFTLRIPQVFSQGTHN